VFCSRLEKIKSDLKKNEQERAKNEQENQELTASKIKLVDEYKKLCHKK
jgi:cell division protein FtsB